MLPIAAAAEKPLSRSEVIRARRRDAARPGLKDFYWKGPREALLFLDDVDGEPVPGQGVRDEQDFSRIAGLPDGLALGGDPLDLDLYLVFRAATLSSSAFFISGCISSSF